MVNGASPPEVPIDERLVVGLLEDQHPDLAGLPVTRFGNGWDNEIFALGESLLVRMPRRAAAVPFARNEHEWLARIAPGLPVAVPAPVRLGEPGRGYPWPWCVVPRFGGEPAATVPFADEVEAARDLAAFLVALHVRAPDGAPTNPYRGIALTEVVDRFEIRRDRLVPRLRAEGRDTVMLEHMFFSGMDAMAHPGPEVWMHGDLHPGNVLVHRGRTAAVIDWGDLCVGDPAGDLQVAWMLFGPAAREAFRDSYGTDADPWLTSRARAWAVHSAFVYLDNDAGDPLMTRIGNMTLDRLLGD
jgi:aminoglycoside phosphotransferase (APT) family kinase protein